MSEMRETYREEKMLTVEGKPDWASIGAEVMALFDDGEQYWIVLERHGLFRVDKGAYDEIVRVHG